MILNPIIPLWLMGIICVVLLCFKRKGIFNYIRQIVMIVIIFVINMRIMIHSGEVNNMTNNVDILFIIDNTISMLAEDYDDGDRRIDAVKEDCKSIMKEFTGASFSVAMFDNNIKRVTPYTTDVNMVTQAIEVIECQSYFYAKGTSLNEIMSKVSPVLENNRDTYKIVFFISDGEVINGDKLKSHSGLAKYADNGAVLGYGTEKGGKMRARAYAGDEDTPEILYYYDGSGEKKVGISKIDEGNLKLIAKDLGVNYVNANSYANVEETVNKIKKDIGKSAKLEQGDSKAGYKETYFYFVAALVVVLAFDYIYYKKKG